MSDENLSQIEILDHKQLMEKIRILCDKIDELFLIYDQLQLAVPNHNADRDAHRDIRELIIALDDREADHYSELSNTITTNNNAVNTRIDNLRTSVETTTGALTDRVDQLDTVTNAIVNGTLTYANPLVSEVRTRTYLNGNNGVSVINSTAPAGYNTIIRVKSTNGVFTESAHNNKYQVSYTADETIAANTNRVDKTNVLIDENGDARFSNNVTVTGTLTAANITGHINDKVDTATAADTATLADKAKSLVSDDTFNTADTHLLKYSSGQFSGIAGSSNDLTALSYPNGATTVNSSNKANIQNVRLLWAGNSKYWHDFFVSPNQRYVWHRDVRNGTANAWARMVEETTDTTWSINISGSAASAISAAEATHAVSADTALQATNATNADKARLATDATHAVSADTAVNATNANYATSAGNATTANTAALATNATNATNDSQGNPIHTRYVNTSAAQDISGDKTFLNKIIVKDSATLNNTSPVLKLSSSSLTAGSKPSVNVEENITYTDKNSVALASVYYRAGTDGSSSIHVTCSNSKRTSSASIDVTFDTLSDTSSVITLNSDTVEPGRVNTTLGTVTNKFAGVYSSGITLDSDGVGTIKLLARVYSGTSSAYANVSGTNLYAVSFVTDTESASGNIVKAPAVLVIDKSSQQQGTWQPLQYLSGSWHSDTGGSTVIGLYRRIL